VGLFLTSTKVLQEVSGSEAVHDIMRFEEVPELAILAYLAAATAKLNRTLNHRSRLDRGNERGGE
jgi:hypothetical protein